MKKIHMTHKINWIKHPYILEVIMSKMEHKKQVQDSTPKHLKKNFYKKATRKQKKLMKDLGIVYHSDISSFSAHALLSKKLGQ